MAEHVTWVLQAQQLKTQLTECKHALESARLMGDQWQQRAEQFEADRQQAAANVRKAEKEVDLIAQENASLVRQVPPIPPAQLPTDWPCMRPAEGLACSVWGALFWLNTACTMSSLCCLPHGAQMHCAILSQRVHTCTH